MAVRLPTFLPSKTPTLRFWEGCLAVGVLERAFLAPLDVCGLWTFTSYPNGCGAMEAIEGPGPFPGETSFHENLGGRLSVNATPRPPALPVPSAPTSPPPPKLACCGQFLSASLSTGSLVPSFPVKFFLPKATGCDWQGDSCRLGTWSMYCSLNAVTSVLSQLLDFAHTVPSGQSTHSTPVLPSLSPPSQVPVPLSRVTSQSCMHLPCSQVSFYHSPLPTGVLNTGFSVTPSPTPHSSSRAAHVSVTFVVSVSGMGLDPQSVNQSIVVS